MEMKIELTERSSERALAVKKRTDMEGLKDVINEGYALILNHLAELGVQASGQPFVAYTGQGSWEKFDTEMGFTVDRDVPCKGDLYMTKTHGGRAVTGTYKGSYEGLEKPYDEIYGYIKENGLEQVGAHYDYYLNDPSVTPENELLTKIVIPVK